MFRHAPKKRSFRNVVTQNQRTRQLRHEQLEDRQLLTTISIGDAVVIEGDQDLAFIDEFAVAAEENMPLRGQVRGPDASGDGVDDIYVASAGTNEIIRFDGVSGTRIDTFVGSQSGGLTDPCDVKFGPDGNLYVTSGGTIYNPDISEILRYNGETGEFIDVFVSGLQMAISFDFGDDGDLYVANRDTNQILQFDGVGPFDAEDANVFVQNAATDHLRQSLFGNDANGDGVRDLYVLSDTDRNILLYDGSSGASLGTFAHFEGCGKLMWADFEVDGPMYVTAYPPPDQVGWSTSLIRLDGQSGEVIDYNGTPVGWSLMVYDAGVVSISGNAAGPFINRFGAASVASLTVTLVEASEAPITVDFESFNGTAEVGEDYKFASGTLTFGPGETTKTIIVATLNNDYGEGSETFTVELSNPVGASIADGVGTVTIIEQSTVFKNNTLQPLNDGKNAARPGVTTSTINVSGLSSILDLNVAVDISHTYDGQLSARLIAPDDTPVELFSNVGGSDDNFTATEFDDNAIVPITSGTAPFTGTFRPAGSLAVLDGIIANGEWRLEISDNTKGDTGTLNSWSLEIAAYAPPATPGVTVQRTSGLETTEGGGSDSFTVVLDSEPTADVTIAISSSDSTEGSVTPSTLTFHAGNWNVPQTVTVTGEDDPDADGNVAYSVITSATESSDPAYSGLSVDNVTVINLDNDSAVVDIYVYEIGFESKRGAKDWRAVFEIRSDSNDDGVGDAADLPVAGVAIEVMFAGQPYTGETDADGVFRTPWIKDIGSGNHYADVVDLMMANYYWNMALDLEDDDILSL